MKRIEDPQAFLADALHVHWIVAHESDTQDDWKYRWNKVTHVIEGLRLGIIYYTSGEFQAIEDDLRLLIKVADCLCRSKYYADLPKFDLTQYVGVPQ